MPVAVLINGVHYAVHSDHLNMPRRLSDANKVVKWQWPYSGFGEIAPQATPATGQAAISYALRYPGQIDDGNGLFYNWHRFYDPRVGRYTSSDPIGLDGGWNRFGYVGGNPLGFADPLGLDAEMCYRPIQGYVIPGKHCFVRFNGDNNDTLSFDPRGVGPDPSPKGATCEKAKGPKDDDCVKREMKKCQGYDFLKNNCCHCVEQALMVCGQSIPPKKWPNWPINPGPQRGEPGYKP